jgi:subtilase family serine protease
MIKSTLPMIVLLAVIAAVFAVSRKQMEMSSATNVVPAGWEVVPKANNANVKLAFFLKLRNVDELQAKVKSVSDPNNSDYSNYLTFAELGRLVMPKPQYLRRVLDLLKANGANESSIDISIMRDVVRVNVPIDGAEKMLGCKYYRFRNSDTSITVLRAPSGYSLPEDVAEGVSFVAGVVGFPSK